MHRSWPRACSLCRSSLQYISTEFEQSRGQLHAPVPSRRAATGLLCLAATILCISGAGLWRYSGAGGLSSYAERAVAFGDSDLQLPANLAGNTGRIRVVHFWDPDCACNKETDTHLHPRRLNGYRLKDAIAGSGVV
jgi:hypothetical protein